MLNAIGQVAHDSMHPWPARHLAHMQSSLARVAVSQHQPARLSLWPDFELVTAPRFTGTFIDFFKANAFIGKVLPDKNRRRLHILAFQLDPKGIIATGQRQKERRATACQWIKDSQSLLI